MNLWKTCLVARRTRPRAPMARVGLLLGLGVLLALFAYPATAQSLTGFLLSDNALQRITLGTGDAEDLAILETDRYGGLALDAQGGLWTIDIDQPALVRLSTQDGAVEETVPVTGLPEVTSPDLVFDACGRLWLATNRLGVASLYSLDSVTGAATLVGETGIEVTSLTSRGNRLIALTYDEAQQESQLVDLDPRDASTFAPRDLESAVARAWIDFSANGSLWGVSPVTGVGPPLPGTTWTADSAGGGRNVVAESFELLQIRGFALAPTQGSCNSADCVAGPTRACVLEDRFEVTVDWQTASSSGQAEVADAQSEDSAIFTFFDPENWEVLVKVLDGCAVNGFTWVYFAATTDVQFRLTVVDTVTGFDSTYESAGGMPAETVTDSGAFPCSSP